MELENIIQQLQGFSDAEDELQLSILDELIQNMQSGSLGSRVYESFFRLFERFPESDGFGVFWSVIHFIEACDGFEPLLVESVLRKSCELNLTMINRLLNAGVSKVNDVDLLTILELVVKNPETSESSLSEAKRFLAYQQKITP